MHSFSSRLLSSSNVFCCSDFSFSTFPARKEDEKQKHGTRRRNSEITRKQRALKPVKWLAINNFWPKVSALAFFLLLCLPWLCFAVLPSFVSFFLFFGCFFLFCLFFFLPFSSIYAFVTTVLCFFLVSSLVSSPFSLLVLVFVVSVHSGCASSQKCRRARITPLIIAARKNTGDGLFFRLPHFCSCSCFFFVVNKTASLHFHFSVIVFPFSYCFYLLVICWCWVVAAALFHDHVLVVRFFLVLTRVVSLLGTESKDRYVTNILHYEEYDLFVLCFLCCWLWF